MEASLQVQKLKKKAQRAQIDFLKQQRLMERAYKARLTSHISRPLGSTGSYIVGIAPSLDIPPVPK